MPNARGGSRVRVRLFRPGDLTIGRGLRVPMAGWILR